MLDTQTGELSSPYNNPPAGALLSIVENFVKEPPLNNRKTTQCDNSAFLETHEEQVLITQFLKMVG